MIYGSVCSGIEAASVAWEPIGWKPAFFSEVKEFPRAVLSHRYPNVPLHGDFTTIRNGDYEPIDVLVGGTPCQSFSVAGLRKGLDDDRGNLSLEFSRLAKRLQPKWIVWENVPGVLSSNGGRDFGSILGAMAELGYGVCYRVLDAQYIRTQRFPRAVPQRRRRVFVVGYLGDWRPAAATLLERESLSRNDPPSRAKKEEANTEYSGECFSFSGQSLTAYDVGNPSPTLDTGCSHFNRGVHIAYSPDVCERIGRVGVRRLSVVECERLQGFPDNYTSVPWRNKDASKCPESHRYEAIGNSMAVNVMDFIGQRIKSVQYLLTHTAL